MAAVTLAQATTIVDGALARGRDLGLRPLTVAVLDPGGALVALKREDDSGVLRPDIAIGKAWGAVGMGEPSRNLATRGPAFLGALAAMSGGKVVPVPGGVLIRNSAGAIIGVVGISGDASAKDEDCAIAGIRAAGLISDPAKPES